VVGTDGSATAGRAVAEAARLAAALGADLHVVSAYEPTAIVAGEFFVAPADDPTAEVLAAASAALADTGVPVRTHAVQGPPADAIVEVARSVGATMIVVGNQGMHGVRSVLGSVPNSVSHVARCSVLIVATGS